MKRILAVSPHLDDAVFSAGGTLAEHALAGDAVTVLTCFTGNVEQPQGFALACQLDKGLAPDIDYMELRRAEDEAACTRIGATALHWPFLEAPHRGYESAPALFGDVLPGDDIAASLCEKLGAFLQNEKFDMCYGPYGIGGHVDHLVVRDALKHVAPACRMIWWEDFPYAMRGAAPAPGMQRHSLSDHSAHRKLAAVLSYRSQLAFQFGSRAGAEETLGQWRYEGLFWERQT